MLSLTMILTDYNCSEKILPHHLISIQPESSDTSEDSGQVSLNYFDNELILNDVNGALTIFYGLIELVPNLTQNFKGCYITSLWQPPRMA